MRVVIRTVNKVFNKLIGNAHIVRTAINIYILIDICFRAWNSTLSKIQLRFCYRTGNIDHRSV